MRRTKASVLAAAAGCVFFNGVAAAVGESVDPGGDYDANHCEMYVDNLGYGSYRYLNHEQKFLDVYLKVNEKDLVERQGDHIAGAGMAVAARSFTASDDADGKAFLDVLEFSEVQQATRVAPGSYQLRFTFEDRSDGQTFFKEVAGVSFFLTVKRSSGRTHRLWIRHRGGPFTLDRIFADGGTEMSLGIGAVRYPDPASIVYDQKRACAPAAPAVR